MNTYLSVKKFICRYHHFHYAHRPQLANFLYSNMYIVSLHLNCFTRHVNLLLKCDILICSIVKKKCKL